MGIPTELGKVNYNTETFASEERESPYHYYTPRLSRAEHAAVSTALASLTKTERVIARAIVEAAGHVYKKPGEEVDTEVYREPSSAETAERTGKSEDAVRRHIKSVKEKTRAQLPEKKPPTGRVKHPTLAAADAHLNEIDMRLSVPSTESVPRVKEKQRRGADCRGGRRPAPAPVPVMRTPEQRQAAVLREQERQDMFRRRNPPVPPPFENTSERAAMNAAIRMQPDVKRWILTAWSEENDTHTIARTVERTVKYVQRVIEKFTKTFTVESDQWVAKAQTPRIQVQPYWNGNSRPGSSGPATVSSCGYSAMIIATDPRYLSKGDLFDGNRAAVEPAFEQASDSWEEPTRDMHTAEPVPVPVDSADCLEMGTIEGANFGDEAESGD